MIRFLIAVHLFNVVSTLSPQIELRYPSRADQAEAKLLTRNVTDELQQIILTAQYLYCPLVPLCENVTRSQPYTAPDVQYGSCCYDCACDISGIAKGEQCPGVEKELNKYDQIESCIRPQFLPYGTTKIDFMRSYYMIIQCASDFKDNIVRNRCVLDQSDFYPPELSLYVPVYSNVTGKLFKNVYCGLCNSEDRNNLINWEIEMVCKGEVPFSRPPLSESELLQMVTQERHCNIRFYSSWTTTNERECDWGFYTTCNQTGKWKTYDSNIEYACNSYTSVYIGKYRNVFCFMCNEHEPPYMGCTLGDFMKDAGGLVGSFTGLIRYRQEPVNIEPGKCTEQEVYDQFKDVCQPVVCPPYYYYNNTDCISLFEDMAYRKYEVYIKVLIESNTEFCKTDTCIRQLVETTEHVLNTQILQLPQFLPTNSGPSDTTISGRFSFPTSGKLEYCPQNTDVFVSSPHMSTNSSIFWFKLVFTKSARHSQQDVLVSIMTSLGDKTVKVNNDNITLIPEVMSEMAFENEAGLSPVLTPRAENNFVCQREMETIKVIHDYFCPRIGLKSNDVNISDSDVIVSNLNTRYNINSVYRDNDKIMVCLNPYKAAFNSVQNKSTGNTPITRTEDDVVEVMLSLVCSTISIICLICVIVVFSLFRELRTIPGINNMILSAHLIVANLLYLFGINAASEVTLCVAVGILTHYFWMASIMWMHVCSIHMFRVFFFMRKLPKNSQSKRVIIAYSIYVVFVSVVVVSVNLIYSSLLQPIKNAYLGYGGDHCYITNPEMVLFAFAIPVGVILLSNVILFCMAIYQIEKLPEVNSADGQNRNMFAIYIKLTCLTGITWIFGFIYEWTLVKAISYVFIVLNASQGLFIFLSFCVNSRVRNLLTSRIKKSHEQSGHTKKSQSTSFISSTRTFLSRFTSRSSKD